MRPEIHVLFSPVVGEFNFRQRFQLFLSCSDTNPIHSLRHRRAKRNGVFPQRLFPISGSCDCSSFGSNRSECTGIPLIRP